MTGHIIICGFGHLGYRVFKLLRLLGSKVAVITLQAPPDWESEVKATGAFFQIADARDDAVLARAGIATAAAIIVVTDDDLVNIAVALDARRLNPKANVVIRLFDQDLAPHVEESLGLSRALSKSVLTAPVLVGAALDKSILGFFECQGESFALREIDESDNSKNALENEGAHLILKCVNNRVEIAGATDIGPGEKGVLVTKAKSSAVASQTHASAKTISSGIKSIIATLKSVPLPLRLILGGLVMLTIFSIALFRYQMNLSWVDSLYFVIATITTVGYGDINFLNASLPVKLFGCVLILGGGALFAIIFGLITDILLSARFERLIGRPPDFKTNHIILSASGHMGCAAARQLKNAGRDVVIAVEAEDVFLKSLRKSYFVVEGDPRNRDVLAMAGVSRASAIIAATDDDVTNLGTVLAAKKLNPDIRTVIRVFDANLSDKLKSHLKIEEVVSSSAVAAPNFVAAALSFGAISGVMWRDTFVILTPSKRSEAKLFSIDLFNCHLDLHRTC